MSRSIASRNIVGLTAGFTPYHHARWQAFAQISGCTCCVVELTNKDEFPVMEYSSAAGSTYERLTLFPRQPDLTVPTGKINSQIDRTLDQRRPESVCLSGYASPLALGALLWCGRNRVPAVMLSESTAWDEPRNRGKEWLKSRIIKACSAALVGGSPHADYMVRLGMPRDRIFFGYDAIDNAHFDPAANKTRVLNQETRRAHGLPESYFMASGRFIPKKNLPGLLRAYARYRQLAAANLPVWDLVILGDGEGRAALAALQTELGLENNVHLVGAKPYEELPFYYGLASAFVHASTTEPWGLVVNEAMASGLPVLVSNQCGCAPDLVQEGVNGFTFDPYQTEDLAQKMLLLSTSDRDQLSKWGRASQERIARWSPRKFAEGLSSAIEVGLARPLPSSTWIDRTLIRGLTYRRKPPL